MGLPKWVAGIANEIAGLIAVVSISRHYKRLPHDTARFWTRDLMQKGEAR
jgi:hypothetical protein